MKILCVMAVVISTGILPAVAHAATYYVRDGGGTYGSGTTACNGLTNAAYTPGIGPNCAVNHPAWIMGGGISGKTTAPVWKGGDTLSISGDSDINPGTQAQYMIGYGMPNTGGCYSAGANICLINGIPAGPSSSQMTKLIGTGSHKAQLWGTEGIQAVIYAEGGNTDIENLEITDHSPCSYGFADPQGTVDGVSAKCNYTGGPYPFGTFAKYGLQAAGNNLITKNLFVHRFGIGNIFFSGNLSNWNTSNDIFVGSGGGGSLTNGGSMSFGGNNTMSNDIWAFGGCSEHYPDVNNNPLDPVNYHHCADQTAGGYNLGGGFMMQNDATGACGNWTITDSQFLYNIKTNIDFLHCNGTGTFNMYRSRSEGSSGEAIKLNVGQVNLEEDQLIANAPSWTISPLAELWSPKDINGNPISPSGYMICRGHANTIFATNSGEHINFINDDVVGNCSAQVVVIQPYSFNGCSGTAVNAYNTKFIGGYAYDVGGQSVDLFYNGGTDGNGAGSCGTPGGASAIPFNMSNCGVYNVQEFGGYGGCTSAHPGSNTVCDDPKITGELSSTLPSLMGPASYYNGTNLGGQLYLQGSSPLKGKGATGITYTNGSPNDYNNHVCNSPPDIGALQSGSCSANGHSCTSNTDCCGGSCTNSVCGSGTALTPTVAITSPSNGASFTGGSNVTVTVTASETSGTIKTISLYNGVGVLLGTGTQSPYSYVATAVVPGTYSFIAQATDANGVSASSTPVAITVTPSGPPSLPTAAVTAPADGSSFPAGSSYTVTATGAETNGTIASTSLYNGAGVMLGSNKSSSVKYTANSMPAGKYSYTAQATDANGVSATSTPVNVTVTSSASPAAAITSPTNGSSFTPGSNVTVIATASATGGSISKLSIYYNGTNLLGTGTSSPLSVTATSVPAGTYALTAVATDSKGTTTTSSPVTINVASQSLPVVSITSPANNSTLVTGSNLGITASASETGGSITKVNFYYNGSNLLGTATSSPYTYTVNNVPAGSYALTAVAYDNNNHTTTSPAVNITVQGTKPVVALTSPANNATFAAGSNITITATASETGGSISQLAINYNGNNSLGVNNSSPYSIMAVNVPSGTYALTATATDSNGVTASSTPVTINVSSLPVVSITSPANNSVMTAGSNITITANATEANGSIKNVDFYYNGTNLLSSLTTPPYSITVNGVPAGTYTLTATAVDSKGVSSTSSPVKVTFQ